MRFLFWLLVLLWGVTLFRRAAAWLLRSLANSQAPPQQSEGDLHPGPSGSHRLVRDPVCGVHITEERALPLQSGAEILHFCSEACRDRYLGSAKKAANG